MTFTEYADLGATYIKQGLWFGSLVWLVIYGINRGWLWFKGIAS